MRRWPLGAQRRALWIGAQVALAVLGVWFAWRMIQPSWPDIELAFDSVTLRVGPLVASYALVAISYGVLIETWRRVVMSWGSNLSFTTAARIWLISNLGRYIPGKVWQITAMGAMAHEAGVSPVAAVGSSLLINVVNVLAGVVVIAVTARDALSLSPAVVAVIVIAFAGTALTPRLLPAISRGLARVLKREVSWPPLPHSTIVVAYLGCATAWVVYGVAFQLLVSAILGEAGSATRYYVAAYTASYLAGYLFLLAPGGLIVRELSLGALLTQFGMATVGQATLITVMSRLWITVIELVPGLILLAFVPKRSPPTRPPLSNDVRSS